MGMSDWAGYLIKAVKTDQVLDAYFIEESSYETTPNSREEIKAYRDENSRDLHRVTAKGHKTSIKFSTRKLHLDDKIEFQKFFTDAETNSEERKLELEYWNDEENKYKTAFFYRADIKFTIRKISDDDIIYEPCEINLVEY